MGHSSISRAEGAQTKEEYHQNHPTPSWKCEDQCSFLSMSTEDLSIRFEPIRWNKSGRFSILSSSAITDKNKFPETLKLRFSISLCLKNSEVPGTLSIASSCLVHRARLSSRGKTKDIREFVCAHLLTLHPRRKAQE